MAAACCQLAGIATGVIACGDEEIAKVVTDRGDVANRPNLIVTRAETEEDSQDGGALEEPGIDSTC